MKAIIDRLDNFGRGITYINNKICFVENALPGEVIDIKIIKETNKYLEGQVVEYIETSKDRVEIDCPYYYECGGCSLRHLNYDKENKYKEEKVRDLLKRIGKLNVKVNDIISSNTNNYRNKVTLHSKNNEIGYYKKNSNVLIPIEYCLLLDDKINTIISSLTRTKNNNKDIIIRVSNDSNNVIVDDNKHIITTVGNKKYRLSRDSFFQVNKFLTEKLYDLVRKSITKRYENVLDLYCGTGSIAIYISDLVNHVTGIDYDKNNILDANYNKKLNNVNNVDFIHSKVENVIDSFTDIDLIIVDPPRSGLDKKTRKNIIKINPERIIYISCDPVTLARDLHELSENYSILGVTPVNMFPRTYHCESIVVLERK